MTPAECRHAHGGGLGRRNPVVGFVVGPHHAKDGKEWPGHDRAPGNHWDVRRRRSST